MAISKLPSGKWKCRLQIPMSGRSADGGIIYRGVQKTFGTKGSAESWERQQRLQTGLTGSDGSLTLTQVSEYRDAKKLAGDGDLRTIVKFWRARNPETASVTVGEAVEAYKASVVWERLAKTTQATKGPPLNSFVAVFGETALSAVIIDQVESYLDAIPNTVTRNNHIRTLKTFFKWTTSRRVRYLKASPIEAIELVPQSYDTPVFMTFEDVRSSYETAPSAGVNAKPSCLAWRRR